MTDGNRRSFRRLFRIDQVKPDPEKDVDSEMEFHFQETVEALTLRGWGLEEAEVEASRRFGDRKRYRKRLLWRVRRRRMKAAVVEVARGWRTA